MPHLIRGLRARAAAALILLTTVLLPGAGLAAFVPGTEDVPLAPGLTASADDALVFDNPTGRIIQATATGVSDADAITRFYAETLPQLGWSRGKDGRWARGDEVLDIAIAMDAASRRLTVRFQLSPAGH
ncbi:hypothetical protein [Niveispirillum cyanobacteriorum]|uniref:Uncharacterized protein n=1 Tax=Niveispirillum cyanobacteriorum TaxID=1612173 RepID=A0A2K9NCH1_9PROT|nr:hypothetical protein [Niveispirillum cyanobacteriorum]AUN30692.1 hypothetical protein C0V82_10890 [Niveispirillum cyanobacteriorum]GGE52304.1 hypothetical protein GCM10011317_08150 [Niveispirillum cyanobacteriorum]